MYISLHVRELELSLETILDHDKRFSKLALTRMNGVKLSLTLSKRLKQSRGYFANPNCS